MNGFKNFLAKAIETKIIPNIKYVKDNYDLYLKNKKQSSQNIPDKLITIYDHLEDYIRVKRDSVSKDTVKSYRSLIKHLKLYEIFIGNKIHFSSFDYNFYDEFVHFLFHDTTKPNGEKGILTNTVGKEVKTLKAFLRDRMRKGYCANIDLSTYKTLTEDVDNIFLTWDEISFIYRFDLSEHPELIPTRDLLVLGCLLGLRFSDLSRISPKHIQNNELRIRQKKVHSPVQIPILNDAADILKKYNWHSPSVPMYEFNRNLKVLGKKVGLNSDFEVIHYQMGKEIASVYKKYELMSSHICRRSFCTNEYLRNRENIHLIMKISGHRTEKAFLTYLKLDGEIASKEIAEQWKNRKLN